MSVSENGDNGLGDEGADGGNALQNFGARTAPASTRLQNYSLAAAQVIIHFGLGFKVKLFGLGREVQRPWHCNQRPSTQGMALALLPTAFGFAVPVQFYLVINTATCIAYSLLEIARNGKADKTIGL